MWAALFILILCLGGGVAACTAALPLLPAPAGAAAQGSAPAGEPHVELWAGAEESTAPASGEPRVYLALVTNGDEPNAAPAVPVAPAFPDTAPESGPDAAAEPALASPLPTPTVSVDALLAALSQTVESAVEAPLAAASGGLLGAVAAAGEQALPAAEPSAEPPGDEPPPATASEPAPETSPETPAETPAADPAEASATAEPAPAAPAPPVPPPSELAGDGQTRSLRVPVLMYHYLSEPPAGADIYRRDLSVAPALFAAHLDRLQAEGYTTITPYALAAALQSGAPLPEKPVLITFDDGYRDNYENALPLLVERGMQATFFVVTDFIDEQRPEYLSWEMARAMLAAGMAVESHGRNHATLEGRSEDYLVWQLLGSLETLQFELGVRPRFLSYPAGDFDGETMRILQEAGFWGAFTTEQGATHTTQQPFELQRLRVRGTTTPDDLVRLLNADW